MKEGIPDWSARLSAWRSSGKSGAAWCRDHGIGYYQFQYWRDKLQRSEAQGKTGQFLPLKVASAPLCIECNGVSLQVSSGFDPVLLQEVISVLRGN
jgi:hypothetical protein